MNKEDCGEDEEMKNVVRSETIIPLHALWKMKNLFQCPMQDATKV